jgi:hypothetical protein
MAADHVNKFLFNETLPGVYQLGRLSMPLFAFVLAYNLARPNALASDAFGRTLKRLIVAGLAATPAFVALVGWWPLNIMFMLALATAILWLLELRTTGTRVAAGGMFVMAGALVEFWWPALALCVTAYWFCKHPTWSRAIGVVAACAALAVINGNQWALASIPAVWLLSRVGVALPRARLFFYAFYPAHLMVLWIAARST